MAVDTTPKGTSAAGRRFFFGTNVTVAILLVVFLVVVVNYLGSKSSARKDVSGGLTGHRLSDRTRKILDKGGGLTITTVYTSDEPENSWKKYLPPLEDYCDEIEQHARGVKVSHIRAGDDRAELRNRVGKKFGSAAQKYDELIQQTYALWDQLEAALPAQQQAIEALAKGDAWLAGFPVLASRAGDLKKDLGNLKETRKEVDDLVKGESLPRYSEANTKITAFNDEVKRHLEELQNWAREMDKLAKVLADPKSDFLTKTREKNQEIVALLTALQKTAGDPADQTVPEDPKPVLQEYGRLAGTLSKLLFEEASRVEAFLKQYPALRNHPQWLMQVNAGILVGHMSIVSMLGETAEALSRNANVLRSAIKEDVPKDQLQNVVRQLREFTGQWGKDLDLWVKRSVIPFEEASRIDEASRNFLAAGSSGEMFKDVLPKFAELADKVKELPELKMDQVAERLQQDNIVVVESDKDVRVVAFDEVWPVADPMGGQFAAKENEPQRRVFDGDSAIASAILSMQSEKPFATVIFVGYENQPPPQMRQFQRPSVGVIPLEGLNTLKERLRRANFAVKDWNLGAEGDAARRPEPEKDTEVIYVFLPPAEAPQMNMFMQQAPQKQFGEPELAKVREALNQGNAKAIFLAVYEWERGPFGPPRSYAYDRLLQDDWGIKAEITRRVVRAVPSKKEPGQYGISPIQFLYTQLNSFTDHVIGKPLKSRRVLMLDVCPVMKAEKVPPDVTLASVLDVSGATRDTWAESDLMRIIKAVREGSRDTTFTRSEDAWNPPFPVIMAAENAKSKSRVVVMGTGASLREEYLATQVRRFEGPQARLVSDPPPTENADLFANALYWLANRPELIAAGPADVPVIGPIEDQSRKGLFMATFVWPFLVLMVGLGMWVVRRK